MPGVRCGEPEQVTGPGASLWPLSCAPLCCAGEVACWSWAQRWQQRSPVQSSMCLLSALCWGFAPQSLFHTMVIGQGIGLF